MFLLSLCMTQFGAGDSHRSGLLVLECPCAPHNSIVKKAVNSFEFTAFLRINLIHSGAPRKSLLDVFFSFLLFQQGIGDDLKSV